MRKRGSGGGDRTDEGTETTEEIREVLFRRRRGEMEGSREKMEEEEARLKGVRAEKWRMGERRSREKIREGRRWEVMRREERGERGEGRGFEKERGK